MNARSQRLLQWAVLVVLAVAAGYAGIRFGSSLRARKEVIVEAPAFPWKPGDPLPDVRLADSTGANVGSAELVRERGGAVVLFLDPNCDGCSAMAQRWEHALAEGVIEPGRVFAITSEPAENNARYRAEHGLSYAIYQDVESAFLNRHGVVTYPMEVVVGAAGTIQSLSTDSRTPIDAGEIRALIGGN
jgi:peroxiredoxin